MRDPIFFYTLNGEYVMARVVDDTQELLMLRDVRLFVPQGNDLRNNRIGLAIIPLPLHDEREPVYYNRGCIVRYLHPTQDVLDKYTEATSGIHIARGQTVRQ